MKNIVVTGCTGVIGSNVVKVALDKGYNVTCIVRKKTNRFCNIPKSDRVIIVECNIDEYKHINLEGKYDAFIHLSWDKTFGAQRDDVLIQMANIQYTLDAVNLANRLGCKVFVGAGSQAEYGIKNKPLTSVMPVNPESGYGVAKYTAGKLANILCSQLGIRFNWLRIVSTYGINDAPYTLVSYVINELKEGRSPELTKCEQIWDYNYCDDAARAFIAVTEKGVAGKMYPLGSGNARKLSDYVKDIQQIVNPTIKLGFGKKEYYPHQPMYLVADISELITDTGWRPIVGFKDGIKKIIES